MRKKKEEEKYDRENKIADRRDRREEEKKNKRGNKRKKRDRGMREEREIEREESLDSLTPRVIGRANGHTQNHTFFLIHNFLLYSNVK